MSEPSSVEPSNVVRPRRRRWRWLVVLAVLIGIVLIAKAFVIDVFLVVEQSMWPGFVGEVDRIVVQRLAPPPRRWEIWLYEGDDSSDRPFVKRVVALPGEFIDLRIGDLYAGSASYPLERLRRPSEVVDAMLVPIYPTPDGEAGLERFRFPVGSPRMDGNVMVFEDKVTAHLKSGLGGTQRENILDDHRRNDGSYLPGSEVVGDVRVDIVVNDVSGGGLLEVWHELNGMAAHRALLIGRGQLRVRIGGHEAALHRALTWDGTFPLALRMSTIDGVFSVSRLDSDGAKEQELLIRERRDTAGHHGYSRVRLTLDSGCARIAKLDVRRDVFWSWSLRRRDAGAYYVDDGVFLLGDNAPVSEDSRETGPVPMERLVGRASRIIWPWDRSRPLP